MSNPFNGILIAVLVYAVGGGLLLFQLGKKDLLRDENEGFIV